jgi:hydroxymethylbilane synthase
MPPENNKTIFIATRGSALALAQANAVLAQCRSAFPRLDIELKIIKTTGDKLQKASLAKEGESLPKGLFTKELEVALLNGEADIAVHSLKDLPTELPTGLILGAVSKRADVRDVLVYRDAEYLRRCGKSDRRGFKPKLAIKDFPEGATVATSSTRRKSQLLAQRADLNVVEIRGNVATRLEKLANQPELDATVLAAAGLERLNFKITAEGNLTGEGIPEGLLATILDLDGMLPCVGQAALGIEIRENDARIQNICDRLNHPETHACVLAERSFLSGMGGGCQSPVAAYAEILGDQVKMRAVSFREANVRRGEGKKPIKEAFALGQELAAKLK